MISLSSKYDVIFTRRPEKLIQTPYNVFSLRLAFNRDRLDSSIKKWRNPSRVRHFLKINCSL